MDAGRSPYPNETPPPTNIIHRRRKVEADERTVIADERPGGRAPPRPARGATPRARLRLLTPDTQHRRIVDSAFAAVGETPRAAIETNSVFTVYARASARPASAVMAHAGLPVLPVGLGGLLEAAPGASSADVRRPAETQSEAPAG